MATIHEIDLSAPSTAPNLSRFSLGTARNPAGAELVADGVSFLLNNRRLTPVMGEFHYSRYPHSEWRDELLKMKAGGIDVVASYVFWIHHEEIEGQWDFTGDRNLAAFVKLCGQLGFWCVLRCGPWDHGEVRNGGFPEWLLDKELKLRTDDPRYLHEASRLYAAIAAGLRGLLWKEGGPVIGIQIENEFGGHAEHLLSLKKLAVDAGLDVPIYTRTGWPELQGHLPFGQLLPLYGGYAEGFWDRALTTMPGAYWREFIFKRVRTDTAIANEQLHARQHEEAEETYHYPYLTCEIGPGMMCSYHRRISVFSTDVLSMVIAKLGSGSNSPGYYMYHGGTNPVGHEPWLQENQATRETNYNDLPVKSYDFQTALGEFGQVREQYHHLRLVHLFLHDYGDRLAAMTAFFPAEQVAGKDDVQTFRWAVRANGQSGFVFINNYQRLLSMPERPDAQLRLSLSDGKLAFPRVPVTIAADRAFCWPFNFDLGDGITLQYATAQLICQLKKGDSAYTVFADTGNPSEFAFTGHAAIAGDFVSEDQGRSIVEHPATGLAPIATLTARNGVTHKIILLDEKTARMCYRGKIAGQEHLLLTPASVIFDDDELRLTTENSDDLPLTILGAPASLRLDGQPLKGVADGEFTRYVIPIAEPEPIEAGIRSVHSHGELRTISLGAHGVAAEPTDADFDSAAVWQLSLPEKIDPSRKLLLRIHYTGDVARACLGDVLLTDSFYNGTPFDIGLTRYGPEAISRGITLKILPLQSNAPIYMLDSVRPDFAGQKYVVSVSRVEIIESHELRLSIS